MGTAGDSRIVLFVAAWGVVTAKLEACGGRADAWSIDASRRGILGFVYIQQPGVWTVVEVEAQIEHNFGIIFVQTKEPRHLLQAALLRRREFSLWELRKAVAQLTDPSPAHADLLARPGKVLLAGLVNIAFPGDPETVAAILEQYEKPPPEEPQPEDDAEMDELPEELAVDEQAHAADLWAFRRELNHHAIIRLA